VTTARRIALILGFLTLGGLVVAVGLLVVLGLRDGMFALVVVAMAVVAAYHRLIHPWHIAWGATRAEVHRHLPGDELVPAAGGTTRAIGIHAPPSLVWPWLVQIGLGRAGWYSYDWIDNDGRPSAHVIRPELQDLAVGDRIPMTPELGFDVVAIDPGRSLVARSGDGSTSWCLLVEPDDAGGTRLISRFRAVVQPSVAAVLWSMVTDPGAFVMERRMLKGIRSRAEALAAAADDGQAASAGRA
jgi:hypothetical protein